jgi:nitrogen fixation NifU-like protein
MHCSVLAEEALKSALDDYYKKQGKPSPVQIPAEAGHEHEME